MSRVLQIILVAFLAVMVGLIVWYGIIIIGAVVR